MSDLEQTSAFLFYNDEHGKISIQVVIGEETVWMSVKGIAELFDIDRSGILKHIQNVYETAELEEKATCAKIAQVQKEGNRDVNRVVDFYNLDMIIAVGYRVNSFKATRFRQWATRILKEYLVKGFVLDDERLKQGNNLFNKDYFKDLLERIREIRASEKMFYEKVKEIYATSVDYDKDDPTTAKFFSTVQNKLEFAVVGMTSPEIIKGRANAKLPHMNLKVWKNSKKDGDIQKSDVTVAKNYLEEEEIKMLNLLVSAFLDYAEIQAQKTTLIKMSEWLNRLDAFLKFYDYPVLNNAGKVSKDVANKHAETEYSKYKVLRDNKSSTEFGKVVSAIKSTGHLPEELKIEPQELSTFDKQLKGMLATPPPDKNK